MLYTTFIWNKMLVARKRADQERREAREERKLKRALKSQQADFVPEVE